MTSTPSQPTADRGTWNERPFSLLGAAALLLEGRRVLIGLGLAGGLIAVLIVSLLPRKYTARAMFIAEQGNESDLAGLAGLAGQFGIPIANSSSGPSPEFYEALATSPVILAPIAAESVTVDGAGADRLPLVELLRARGDTEERRRERATEKLQEIVSATHNRRTGVIALRVRTKWPRASEQIAARILERLNDFNLNTRQSRARAERIFVEARTAEAKQRLRAAEEELLRFTVRNRSVGESPTLTLEKERRERELLLAQQVLGSLEPMLEEARLREVKDTPVITILQRPTVLSVADPRGRVKFGLFGGILGVLLGLLILPVRRALSEARDEDDPEARRFFRALDEARRGLFRRSTGA